MCMNEQAKQILSEIEQHLTKYQQCRFTQALFNLGITEFKDKEDPGVFGHLLRDPYADSDTEVLFRINEQHKRVKFYNNG